MSASLYPVNENGRSRGGDRQEGNQNQQEGIERSSHLHILSGFELMT